MLATSHAAGQKVSLNPEPLYRLLFGRCLTEALFTAHELKIFQLLSDGALTLGDFCARLHLPEHSAAMLLNLCVALGLLKKDDDRFANAPLAQDYLVEGRPFYLGGLMSHFRAHVFPAWDRLKQAIERDGPQIRGRAGVDAGDIFQLTDTLDEDTRLFISAMHNLSISDGIVLAEQFDFSPYKQLVDIGGGSGALSLAVAGRYPSLQAIVMDRRSVCGIADRYIEEAGASAQVRTHAGNAFTDALPEGTDVFLLSLFIHAFGLEKARPIMEKCFQSLPSGGCVLIYEPMLDPARTGPLMTLWSSLNMLVVTPSGGDVTADDYRGWLQDIGFERVSYLPCPSIRHLVIGYKP